MPGDVAVQEPHARIVGLEGQDQIPVRGQQGHVASGGVVEVECHQRIPVWLIGLGQDGEVVAVQVDLFGRSVLRSG